MSDENPDKGWEYLQNDGEEGSFFEDDGSWGSQNADGSGSYFGADGSWGTKNADGSGSFYGADGSWGTRNTDGSISYYGKGDTWGYRNADGSGAYYGSNGDNNYYDAAGDADNSGYGDLSDALAGLFTVVLDAGIAAYSSKKQQERDKNAWLQAEQDRIQLEKEKDRKAKNALKKKRMKAFLFRGKKIAIAYDCETLIGKNVEYVTSAFRNEAFSNVHVIPLKDVYKGSVYVVGQVEQIVINGSSYFRKGELLPYDAEIIITYHAKREIVMPFSERKLRKMSYMTAGNQFEELGFTEIYEKPIRDLVTGWVKRAGSVERITIGDANSFKKNSVFPYDVRITIEYHTFKEK